MAVTIHDVARETGVSIRTVSRVINNRGRVSAATRQRVLAVIEELGYRPNGLARGLVSGKTLSVGLIVPQITDPFFPEVVLGVERVAHKHQHSVFLCNTSEDPQLELYYLDALASKQVDGIILCGTRLTTTQLSEVAACHRVVILTSRKPRNVATVTIQAGAGMYELTSHLISLGHQTIGYIGRQEVEGNERADGYFQALSKNGIKADRSWCVMAPKVSIEAGSQMTRQILEQIPEMTAILCYDDQMAIGAIQACGELGCRVPQDIAVAGFDDISLASLVTPALTTMSVPRYRLGEMLMELLLRVMAMDGVHEEHLYVRPELIIRESCGTK
jgi:DNA-binding LacI/PurR family transcriptional regulator